MMCQRMGFPPISTMGFGLTAVSSVRRVPTPPARITAFIDERRLVGAAAGEDNRDRHAENSQVTCDRQIFDVVTLEREPFFESELSTSVDLHGPRDAGFDGEAEEMLGLVARNKLDLLGSRSDEAHVSNEHVEELRQLVQARAAKHGTHTRDAGIILELEHWLSKVLEGQEVAQHVLGVSDHRPELEHLEWSPLAPSATLREEH